MQLQYYRYQWSLYISVVFANNVLRSLYVFAILYIHLHRLHVFKIIVTLMSLYDGQLLKYLFCNSLSQVTSAIRLVNAKLSYLYLTQH